MHRSLRNAADFDGTGACYRLGQFEVAEDSRCGAADDVGVALARERDVESMKSPFAAFVVLERVDRSDPGFEGRVAESLHNIKEVFAQLVGEFGHVLIDVQKLGEDATRFGREGREIGQLL